MMAHTVACLLVIAATAQPAAAQSLSIPFSRWATVTPASGWVFVAGQFSGDCSTDVAGYHPGNGTVWVGTNTGSSFSFSRWANVTPASGWSFVAGDFIDDIRAEIVGYNPNDGSLSVGSNTGSSFSFNRWTNVTPASGWSFVASDFTSDGRADVVGYHPGNGSLWVGTNTGSGFSFTRWSTVSPISGWSFVAADFTGDGQADVVGYHPGNGSLWMGTNTGSSFSFTRWTTLTPASGWSLVAGDFTGDSLADVAGYHPGNGSLWVGANTGSSFSFTRWTTLAPAAGWSLVAGEFSGNGQADIAAYQPANGTLWTGVSAGAAIPAVTSVSEFQPAVRAGGRAVAIAVHPTNASQILVASETGGLFRTSNGGRTWTHVPALQNHRIWDVEFSPNNPNLVVAAAESNFRIPNDGGIWRSTDGGLSWTRPSGAVPVPGPRCAARSGAYDVTFQAGTTNIFVGADCGVAVSRDNGATWVHTPLNPSASVNATRTQNAVFSVLATANQVVLVAAADGLWRSGSSGGSWVRITNGPQRGQTKINHAFAVSPVNPNHIFHAGGFQQLFRSINAGVDWTQVTAPSRSDGRGVFVRATRARSGNASQIDVYFGDGVNLHRQTFTAAGTSLTGSGSWTRLDVDHADPADIGFDGAGAPVLVATDGGVHLSPDGGNTWRLTGGGRGGFNALQIYEVTGQTVIGTQAHQDLYYATQDNNVVASFDGGLTWPVQPCCEGNFIRVTPGAAGHLGMLVTGAIGSPFFNFASDAHLCNIRQFPNPPDGDSTNGDVDGNPFLVLPGSGMYLQNTVNNDAMTPVNAFRLTIDSGGSWRPAFTIPQQVAGPPVIAGRPNPTFYQAVLRPGTTPDGINRVGLVRAINFLAGPGTVSDADVSGFGSIGVFPGVFPFYRIFAANPVNALQLIYADAETSEMKYSVDGGQNWFVDRALTDAVTGNGAFAFRVGEVTHVRTIGFDPFNPCLILVGTDQNGVIRSVDGGNTWARLPGSASITWITSFYFPVSGPVIASSYGRGLWRLNARPAQTTCQPPTPPGMVRGPGRMIEAATGASAPFRDFGDPAVCANCSYIVVRNGVVNDLEMKGGSLAAVAVSGGSVHQLAADKREVPLSIPNEYVTERSSFDQFPALRPLLAEKGALIRGVVVEGDVLRSVIVSEAELPFNPARVPYLRLTSANMGGGGVRVESGGTIRIHGEGFTTSTGAQNGVRILLGDEVVARDIVVDNNGAFRSDVAVRRMPGPYEIAVEQQDGRRLTRATGTVQVIVQDRPR